MPKFLQSGFVTPGVYRTRDDRTVKIIGPHPRFPHLMISDEWSEKAGSQWCWLTNGEHPDSDDCGDYDLVRRLE